MFENDSASNNNTMYWFGSRCEGVVNQSTKSIGSLPF